MAEKVAVDVKNACNEDVGSMLDMMNLYKRKQRTLKEEIRKYEEVIVVKFKEDANLDAELQSLKDHRKQAIEQGKQKMEDMKQKIKEN